MGASRTTVGRKSLGMINLWPPTKALLLLLGCVVFVANAQSLPKNGAISIEGMVRDVNSSIVPGAKLSVEGTFCASTITDRDGKYRMKLPPGTYVVHVVAPFDGFAKIDRPELRLMAASNKLNFVLFPSRPVLSAYPGRADLDDAVLSPFRQADIAIVLEDGGTGVGRVLFGTKQEVGGSLRFSTFSSWNHASQFFYGLCTLYSNSLLIDKSGTHVSSEEDAQLECGDRRQLVSVGVKLSFDGNMIVVSRR